MRSVNRAHLYFPILLDFHLVPVFNRDEAPQSLGTPQLGSNRVLHMLEPLATWHRSLYGPLIEDIKESKPRVRPLFSLTHTPSIISTYVVKPVRSCLHSEDLPRHHPLFRLQPSREFRACRVHPVRRPTEETTASRRPPISSSRLLFTVLNIHLNC